MKTKKAKALLALFPPAKSTGELLRSWRKSFEVTQGELAAMTGIPQANLSAIENDRRDIGPDVALKLAAAIGVSPELVLYPGGYESEPSFIEVQKRAAAIGGARRR